MHLIVQEVVIASFIFSLKDPWHDPEGFVVLYFLWVVVVRGSVVNVLTIWQVLVLGLDVSFFCIYFFAY